MCRDVSGRAVSRDSQRRRHRTPDEPVEDLPIKVDRRLPSCSSSCLFHEADRRLDSSSTFLAFLSARSSRKADRPTRCSGSFSPSRWSTDLMQSLPCLSFGSLLTKADRKTDTAVPCTADRRHLDALSPTFAFLALASLGHTLSADCSSQSTGRRLFRRG